ncbi:MAG TPA: hypothetical protein DCP31_09945 [Cyanobacteria bacterium UBA8543]|nr:hypothetical protein [Cyanobacteria bacterium UBA8543]
MTWLSINPNSEPRSSVEVVADAFNLHPTQVNCHDMAIFYNRYLDPTVTKLEVTPEAKSRFVDRWLSEPGTEPSEPDA